MNRLVLLLLFFLSTQLISQNTIGTIAISNGVQEGYTLFSIHQKTYLINNCGQVINEWTSNYPPGNAVYLLENGNILRAGRIENGSPVNFGGVGGVVEIFDWDGNLVWQYVYSDNEKRQHHDVFPMPNGNVLILAATIIEPADAIEMGRDPNLITEASVYNEQIIEVTPVGSNQANLVWEWNVKDHLVQDFDNTKSNFGVVQDSPEKLDINFLNGGTGGANWLHVNSIQYDETLDQIVLSSRNLSEIWIIDHSTTTQEAATGAGGNYGKGGDFLYRWGNPEAYKRGTSSDRILYGQHYPHYIQPGLPNERDMLVFNNGNGRTPFFSEVFRFTVPQSSTGVYDLNTNNIFDPESVDFAFEGKSTGNSDFYSAILSSAQQLPNGNTLICEGRSGEIFEIDSNKDIVWEYINPVSNVDGVIFDQGDAAPNTNLTFRALKYVPSYPAFQGRDLTPKDPIEGNFNLDPCTSLSNTVISKVDFELFPNPVQDVLKITSKDDPAQLIWIYNLTGKQVFKSNIVNNEVDLKMLNPGIYFVKIQNQKGIVRKKLVKY